MSAFSANHVKIDIFMEPEWDALLMIKSVVGNCEPTFSAFHYGYNPNGTDSENPLSEESDTTDIDDDQLEPQKCCV